MFIYAAFVTVKIAGDWPPNKQDANANAVIGRSSVLKIFLQ